MVLVQHQPATASSGSTTLNSDAQENTVGGTDAGLNLDTDGLNTLSVIRQVNK